LARAPVCDAGGREFKPRYPPHAMLAETLARKEAS
jgi:hypothetical protein